MRGVTPLPEAIRKITSLPASVLGLIDRGTIAAGQFADINVIHDAPHLITRAQGYAATLVNGVPILIDDDLTGLAPVSSSANSIAE